MNKIFADSLSEHQALFQSLGSLQDQLESLALQAIACLQNGGKILIFGNGGSASDAQHIAAELTGRFEKSRRGLSAVALTTDTSALTAIANDFGFESVFSRQVEAIAKQGDLLIGISTSGNSPNVIKAFEAGSEIGCIPFGFSGKDGGKMNHLLGEKNLVIPSDRTARIQEAHIFLGHTLCELIEKSEAW